MTSTNGSTNGLDSTGARTEYRNVLVVGGTSGLGQAVAREFARNARTVHISYHGRHELAQKAAADVSNLGGSAQVHQLTLPDDDPKGPNIRRLFGEIGPCDAVVNCAVTNDAVMATIANAARFRAVVDANIFGTYQVSSIAAQAMAATGGGCVVNISSILTKKYIVGAMGYITSKAAIESMTRGFAREFGRLGVRFTAVSPGPIRDTRLLATVPQEAIEEIMGGPDYEERLLPPQKVAAAVRAIAGPEFSAMNGEVVTVDDGFSL
ncbi:SDR family oxidoreductase [Nocardiopsis rhodophaea]|uniref:SDR family oxidoreductase n=1 Tax=Nocardiopsis rhodophaea TaxID=280238 RepID=A0ABP5F028_9ACTN